MLRLCHPFYDKGYNKEYIHDYIVKNKYTISLNQLRSSEESQ